MSRKRALPSRKPPAARNPRPTPMDQQAAMASKPDRFLPQNLPEAKFRQLLRLAWAWNSPAGIDDPRPLMDYVVDVLNARQSVTPALPVGQFARRLHHPPLDVAAWTQALVWVGAALTAEWGHREGFVGPSGFDLGNYDLESRQRWGMPKVPGAIAVSAAPNNALVAQLAEAMDAVFDPAAPPSSCAYCNRSAQFRDLAAITEAVAAADHAVGYTASSDAPPWRLSGAVTALGVSEHFLHGSTEVREHCYHVAHGSLSSAEFKFARDQRVKPCGDWCNPQLALVDSVKWSAVFAAALETRAQALVRQGHLKPEDIAILYAAAVERMSMETMDYDAVHIAHSVCHQVMDHLAPNPVRH